MKHGVRILALATLIVAACQSFAWASWTAPLGEWGVSLPYGAACASGTHRGVDLAARAGSPVFAPVTGTVTFAGRVPADGGGTCGAVTIETPDGLRISLLPLAELSIDTGGYIGAGDEVGTLAPAGDESSSETHLHLGLRRGDVYLDPSSLLPSPGMPATSSSDTAPAASTGAATGTPVAPPQVIHGIASASPVSAPVASLSPAAASPTGEPAQVQSRSLSALESGFGTQVPVEAGIPDASALQPELRPARGRLQVGIAAPSGQTALSAVLLLGMLATAVGIAGPRLAAVRD